MRMVWSLNVHGGGRAGRLKWFLNIIRGRFIISVDLMYKTRGMSIDNSVWEFLAWNGVFSLASETFVEESSPESQIVDFKAFTTKLESGYS